MQHFNIESYPRKFSSNLYLVSHVRTNEKRPRVQLVDEAELIAESVELFELLGIHSGSDDVLVRQRARPEHIYQVTLELSKVNQRHAGTRTTLYPRCTFQNLKINIRLAH